MGSRIATCIRFFLLSTLYSSDALRILVSFPMFSKSHNILGQGVVNNLLGAGHEVVFLTSFPRATPVQNLTEIDCSPIALEHLKQANISDSFKLQNLVGKSNVADSIGFLLFTGEFNRMFLEYKRVNTFLSDPREQFDLAIMEWFFSETVAGIPALFQCPFIWIASTEVHGHVLRVIDEVPNPAYSADLFSTSTPPFTFWERAVELATACWRHFVVNFIVVPFEKSLYNRMYPVIAARRGVSIPTYEETAYNASMMLVNSHPSVGTPFKLPQNVKYIGGYHIDRNVQPLPKENSRTGLAFVYSTLTDDSVVEDSHYTQLRIGTGLRARMPELIHSGRQIDLQKIMDKSKDGVIYFSMGSNLQSKDMSAKMKESLVKMIGTLNLDVIWKFEDNMDNVPSNLHLVKWAPQTSILAHPKIKLFITHGGQLSTTEAIHFGVPLIGLPMFGDQYVNMQSVVKKGFGVMLKISEDFTDDLRAAVEKVLENPEYMNKAKYLSSVYHDRMTTPGDELVYWAEHVVRTKGALHLRSLASMVSWYQKMYLDLIAVLILIVFLLFSCGRVGWKILKSKITRSNKEKKN